MRTELTAQSMHLTKAVAIIVTKTTQSLELWIEAEQLATEDEAGLGHNALRYNLLGLNIC